MAEKVKLMEDLIEDVRKLMAKAQEVYDKLEPVTSARFQEKFKEVQVKLGTLLADLEELKSQLEPFTIV